MYVQVLRSLFTYYHYSLQYCINMYCNLRPRHVTATVTALSIPCALRGSTTST